MQETFKDIKGYEGIYQASNLGNIKSLSRIIRNRYSYFLSKEKILNPSIDKRGYKRVILRKKGKNHGCLISRLVAQVFLNYDLSDKKLVVDHINNDKGNNNVNNLQIITQRANSSKKERGNETSEYVGVSFCNHNKKWLSQITINKKSITLGYFNFEINAHNSYQEALKNIDNYVL